MKPRLFLAALVLSLAPACAVKRPAAQPQPLPPGQALFVGTLPCPSDCKGVLTELTLIDSGRRFHMRETFIGTDHGDEVVESQGEWSHLKGHGRNAKATVLELTSESFDQERYFLRLGNGALRVLDSQGREFLSKENSVLIRQDRR